MATPRQYKYDKRHFVVLSTKVRRSKAIAFKGLCYEKGKTVNAVLREYVNACIESDRIIKKEVRAQANKKLL